MQVNPAQSWILDPRRGFRIPWYWSLVFVTETWILDSNLEKDSRFLELYFGFQSPAFRIPETNFPRF